MKQICFDMAKHPISKDRVFQLLQKLDEQYIPPIHTLTSLEKYAEKLADKADILFAISGDEDIGLCAMYTNQPPYGYITSIGIVIEMQGCGLGSRLLDTALAYMIEKKCTLISLEVYTANSKAIALYRKKGFVLQKRKDEKMLMCKKLK